MFNILPYSIFVNHFFTQRRQFFYLMMIKQKGDIRSVSCLILRSLPFIINLDGMNTFFLLQNKTEQEEQMMKIRLAESRDIPALDHLLYQVNNVHADGRPDIFIHDRKKYTDEELTLLLQDETRPVFVFEEEDGSIPGYCFCIVEVTEGGGNLRPMKTLYIDDLCVDETRRGEHIGTQLYDYVKHWAAAQGFYRITLNVWELNGPASAFYRHLGLKPLKTTMEELL